MGGAAQSWQSRFIDPRGSMVGEYRIERAIAWGGMGVIYLAENPLVGSRAAAKVLREELSLHPGIAERFLEEASAASKIRHPNTVQIYSFVSLSDGRPCILMEYLEGETLEKRAKAPLSLAKARPILLQVSAALGAGHVLGIVHRDLKAENILLITREGRDDFVKLLDYGLAKSTALAAGVSLPGSPAGTPFYMSPEQVRGEPVDARTDVYALGILAYRLLLGRFPFEGESIEQIMYKQVHQQVDLSMLDWATAAVLAQAMAKIREDRYASTQEFAMALSELPLPESAPALEAPPADWMQEPASPPPRMPTPPRSPTPAPAPQAERRPTPVPVAPAPPPTPLPEAPPVAPATWTSSPTPWPVMPTPVQLERPPARLDSPPIAAAAPAKEASKAVEVERPAPAVKADPAPPVVAKPAPSSAKPAPAAARRDTPAKVLERYLELSDRDHYAFLGAAEDAEAAEIRLASRRVEEELQEARGKAPIAQQAQFAALMRRLSRARQILDDLESRAAFDARSGNFRGVASCLAAGLAAARLEKLHQDYVTRFPDRIAKANDYAKAIAVSLEAGGRGKAREAVELALSHDPLSPELQRQWSELRPR